MVTRKRFGQGLKWCKKSLPFHLSTLEHSVRSIRKYNPGVPKEGTADEICSTQMTHADHQRKPFWFNNGMAVNKFEHNSPIAEMTHFMIQKAVEGEWTLKEHNEACLKNEGTLQALDGATFQKLKQMGTIWNQIMNNN
jgi:hypothetical protein